MRIESIKVKKKKGRGATCGDEVSRAKLLPSSPLGKNASYARKTSTSFAGLVCVAGQKLMVSISLKPLKN